MGGYVNKIKLTKFGNYDTFEKTTVETDKKIQVFNL